MNLTVKNLAQGVISSTSSATPNILYPTAASARGALIKSIVLSNSTGGVDAKIQLKVRPSMASTHDRYIAPVDLLITGGAIFVLEADITLSLASPQDQIIAWADPGHGSAIHYIISGVERDQ
jgi:hypothetical protein